MGLCCYYGPIMGKSPINENPNSFYKVYYQKANKITININFYNGQIESIDLLKNLGKNYVNISNNKTIEKPSHVFNLINKGSDDPNYFFQSNLDEGIYKNTPWTLEGSQDQKTHIITQEGQNHQLTFKKTVQGKTFFRCYTVGETGITVEENGDFNNHYFKIKNYINDFQKLYINNNNIDGGQYIVEYANKKNSKFTLVNNNRGEVPLDRLNFIIESNNPTKNSFFTLWENNRAFIMVQPLDTDSSFNKSIFLNKKNHHWVLEYNNNGIKNQSRKLLIIYDVKRLESTAKHNNFMINYVFPISNLDRVRLFFINNSRRWINFLRIGNVLGILLMIVLLRLVAILILFWLRQRFGIEKSYNFLMGFSSPQNQDKLLLYFIAGFVDLIPLIITNMVNNNSSILMMEPLLWIKDFSWEDGFQWGWRFFTFSPVALATASSFVLFNSQMKTNNPSPITVKQSYVGTAGGIILLSFLARYVITPTNGCYFIIQNFLAWSYDKFLHRNNITRRS